MKRVILFGLVAVLMTFLAAPGLYAAVVYDNGGPNGSSGNEMTQWIQSEDFKFASAQTFNQVTFWGFAEYGSSYTGNITWMIYNDNGGQPGTIQSTGNVAVPGVASGTTTWGPEYVYTFNIPSFTAAAGAMYWLGLHNGDLTNTGRADFYWETTNGNGTATGHEWDLQGTGYWYDNGAEHAFQLSSSPVPIPGALLLFGPGLLGLAAVRRRFKK